MPGTASYVGTSVAITSGIGAGSGVLSRLFTAIPNPPYSPAYAPTPENLVILLRAKAKATLTECTKFPESLDTAQQLSEEDLPYLGIFLLDPADVSTNYGVTTQASAYSVDFVYVAKQAADGATDDAQSIRARLDALEAAFYADFHLSGLVTMTETVNPPGNKANQYNQIFATDGQPVTVMVLTMSFTVLKDIPNG